MKKILILIFTFLIVINVGCESKQTKQSNEPYIYLEEFEPNESNPWKSEIIYQDSEYKYFLGSYKKTYIEYKEKQYSYAEALDENIVTMDDLINAGVQIYKRRCHNYKISDELHIYIEEIPPYESQPAMTETVYEDSKYRYVVAPYKKAYVEYNGKRYGYSEALKEHIITLDDLANAGVDILKKKIGSNKYEEYQEKQYNSSKALNE